jgi:hypothetical protein
MPNRTKMATLIMSAMIGEAVAIEFLRRLSPDDRAAATERMLQTVRASVKEYANEKVASPNPTDTVGHQMMASDMERGCEPMLRALVDLAGKDG